MVFYEDVFSVRMIMWLYSRNGIIWNEIYMECDGIYGM